MRWDALELCSGRLCLCVASDPLGVSFMAYLADRISERFALPSLASLITEKARQLNLGASWE